MAVNDTTVNNSQAPFGGAEQTSNPAQTGYGANRNQRGYQQPAPSGRSGGFSSFRAPAGLEQNSAYVNSFVDKFNEFAKGMGSNLEVKVTAVTSDTDPRLKISALVVACRFTDRADAGMAFMPVLLARTAGVIGPVELPVDDSPNARKIEVVRTAGDGADDVMRVVTHAKVATLPGVTSATPLVFVPAMVVPANRNGNDEFAYPIFINAVRACFVSLADHLGMAGANQLNQMVDNQRYTIRPTFEKNEITNAVGELVRQDFRIEMNRRTLNQASITRDLNNGNEEMQEMAVSGYLNLSWISTEELVHCMNLNPNQPPTQHYLPSIVLNNFETGDSCNRGAVLLSIQMATALTIQNNWINVLRNVNPKDKLHDIGVLGIESSVTGNPADRAYQQFSPDDAGMNMRDRYLKAMVWHEPEFLLSIPDAGPSTWNLDFIRIIARATSGDPVIVNGENISERVKDEVIAELDVMTDGRFSQIYDRNDFMFSMNTEQHTGTVVDPSGAEVSLEEIDYLAVASSVLPQLGPDGSDRRNALQDFSRTYVDPQMPIDEALHVRLKIANELYANVQVTGRSTIVTVSPALLGAMSQAFKDSRFAPILSGTNNAFDNYNRSSYRANVLSSGQTTNMRVGGYGGYNNGYGNQASGNRGFFYRNYGTSRG